MRAEGAKELIARAADRRGSASWADLLRECALHAMRTSVLAVGDGALGISKALVEVSPRNPTSKVLGS